MNSKRRSLKLLVAAPLILSLIVCCAGCATSQTDAESPSPAVSSSSIAGISTEDAIRDDFSNKGYAITTSPYRIKNERFVLELPENVYVPATIEQDITTVMDAIENTTSLSFFPEGGNFEPVVISVVRSNPSERSDYIPESGSAMAIGGYGIEVSPLDIVLDSGEGWVMTHELLHVLNQRESGALLTTPLSEGFTTYWTQKIIEGKHYNTTFNSYINYSDADLDNEITPQTAEAKFIECDYDGWVGYKYGFRMMHYIDESGYSDGYIELCRRHIDEAGMTNADIVPFVKEQFGDDFFTEFGKWFQNNRDRFSGGSLTNDYTYKQQIDVFPVIASWDMYNPLNFTYSESILLDFSKGNEYITEYLGRELTGRLHVKALADGSSTITFIDADGKSVQTDDLTGKGEMYYDVEGAVSIRIEGDGKRVSIEPIFDQIVKG